MFTLVNLIPQLIYLLLSFKLITTSSNYHLRSLDKTIEVSMIYQSNKLFIPINIGQPKQSFNILFDTGSFHFWMYNSTLKSEIQSTFDSSLSKTFQRNTQDLSFITQSTKGNEVTDIVYFNSHYNNDKNFSWLLVNKETLGYTFSGVLGFAMKYPGKIAMNTMQTLEAHPKYSYIHNLYHNGLIDRKIFAQRFISPTEAKLYIGSSGTSISNYPKCKLNKDNKSNERVPKNEFLWRCDLNGFSFGYDLGYDIDFNNTNVIFASHQDYLSIPHNMTMKIFPFIVKALNATCSFRFVQTKGMAVLCTEGLDLNNVPDFRIRLKGMEIVIKGEDLFEPHFFEYNGKEIYGYIARIFSDTHHLTTFTIGTIAMKYYHMVFDMEDESVGFAERVSIFDNSDNYDYKNKDRNVLFRSNDSSSIWLKMIIFVLLMGIGAYSVVLFMKRRRKLRKIVSNSDSKQNDNTNTNIDPIGQPMINK